MHRQRAVPEVEDEMGKWWKPQEKMKIFHRDKQERIGWKFSLSFHLGWISRCKLLAGNCRFVCLSENQSDLTKTFRQTLKFYYKTDVTHFVTHKSQFWIIFKLFLIFQKKTFLIFRETLLVFFKKDWTQFLFLMKSFCHQMSRSKVSKIFLKTF